MYRGDLIIVLLAVLFAIGDGAVVLVLWWREACAPEAKQAIFQGAFAQSTLFSAWLGRSIAISRRPDIPQGVTSRPIVALMLAVAALEGAWFAVQRIGDVSLYSTGGLPFGYTIPGDSPESRGCLVWGSIAAAVAAWFHNSSLYAKTIRRSRVRRPQPRQFSLAWLFLVLTAAALLFTALRGANIPEGNQEKNTALLGALAGFACAGSLVHLVISIGIPWALSLFVNPDPYLGPFFSLQILGGAVLVIATRIDDK